MQQPYVGLWLASTDEAEKARLKDQNVYLLDESRSERNFRDIIGASAGLRRLCRRFSLLYLPIPS